MRTKNNSIKLVIPKKLLRDVAFYFPGVTISNINSVSSLIEVVLPANTSEKKVKDWLKSTKYQR